MIVPREAALAQWRRRLWWFVVGGVFGLLSLVIFGTLGHRALKAEAAANEGMRQAIETEQLLMSELEHRVKNSLFLAESLLALQSVHSGSAEVREILHSARARIRAIARVHARLRTDRNPALVSIDQYVRELCADLEATVPLRCRVESEPVVVRTERAVPVGLIVTELLINAAKHGARAGVARVDVGIHVAGNELVLTVRDWGGGVPPGFQISDRASLGLRIISKLVRQLDGYIGCDNAEPGARFTVNVPLSDSVPSRASA